MPTLDETFHPEEPTTALTLCAHKTKRGKQCEEEAVEGDEFCVLHGASITVSQEAVTRRILSLQMKSLKTLEDVMVGGYDEKCRVSAALGLLDRGGNGPKSTLIVNRPEDLEKLPTEAIAQELDALAKTARTELQRKRMNEKPMIRKVSG